MILILSDKDEPTTDLVIDWLLFLEKDFLRIACSDLIQIEKIFFENEDLEAILKIDNGFRSVLQETRDISSYWYRRSILNLKWERIVCQSKETDYAINRFGKDETISAIQIINHILNRKKRINSYNDNSMLKLEALETAKKNGLSVPDTIICSNKLLLKAFYKKHHGKIITKTIGDPCSFYNYNYSVNTKQVDLSKLPDSFGISLFQEMVEKLVELRIFVCNKTFYGSAVFSQSNPATRIDLKSCDMNNPNRVVPFQLPYGVEQQLIGLMSELNLNSGSIDMIITPDLEYVFLEINPVGQFEQVAMPCNYNLFRIVAEYLE